MPMLKVFSTDSRRVEHEIRAASAEITIGRSADNVLVVPHPSVSRLHARIHGTSGGYMIVDMGSHNGVWVNGHRVSEGMLLSGDTFRVGDCPVQILDDDARSARSSDARAPAPKPRWAFWTVAVLFMAVLSACGGGVLVYLLRDAWRPLLP
jgi:predicted component of type VI protein secretion system